jgi:hypothetical protein
MPWTVLVHTEGFGYRFQFLIHSRTSFSEAATLL